MWIKYALCFGVCLRVHTGECEWTYMCTLQSFTLLQLPPLVSRDSCAPLPDRGGQLKPSGSVRGAALLSEPAEL